MNSNSPASHEGIWGGGGTKPAMVYEGKGSGETLVNLRWTEYGLQKGKGEESTGKTCSATSKLRDQNFIKDAWFLPGRSVVKPRGTGNNFMP